MILTTRYESNPKGSAWKVSKKFMSWKIYVLKESSVDKPHSSICKS